MRRLLLASAALTALCAPASAQFISGPGVVSNNSLTAGSCLQATGPNGIGTIGQPGTVTPCGTGAGSGNVSGPTSSTAEDIAIWTNGTGTTLGDSGVAFGDVATLDGAQVFTGLKTFAGAVKAVSFTSFGGVSTLTDAGLSTPNVVTSTLNVSGAAGFTQRPTVAGNPVWDAGNLVSPLTTSGGDSRYLLISGGTVNGSLNYNSVGSVFRGANLEWSGVALWKVGSDSAQTGTGNCGGDLDFYAYADNGAFLGSSAVVTRCTRVWNFVNSPIVPTPSAGDNSQNVATTAFVRNVTQSGSGSPAYFELPLITNAQITAGGKVAGIILPHGVNFPNGFTTSQGYADTPASGSVEFEVNWNGTPYAAVTCLSGFNKCNFSIFANPGPGAASPVAGDRIDIVYLAGVVGPLGGLHLTLSGVWQ